MDCLSFTLKCIKIANESADRANKIHFRNK